MTILHVTLIAAVLVIGLALAGVTSQVAARGHARAVADLAALAAAHAGECRAAADVVRENPGHRVVLARCEISGFFAQVSVQVPGPFGAEFISRAGPQW